MLQKFQEFSKQADGLAKKPGNENLATISKFFKEFEASSSFVDFQASGTYKTFLEFANQQNLDTELQLDDSKYPYPHLIMIYTMALLDQKPLEDLNSLYGHIFEKYSSEEIQTLFSKVSPAINTLPPLTIASIIHFPHLDLYPDASIDKSEIEENLAICHHIIAQKEYYQDLLPYFLKLIRKINDTDTAQANSFVKTLNTDDSPKIVFLYNNEESSKTLDEIVQAVLSEEMLVDNLKIIGIEKEKENIIDNQPEVHSEPITLVDEKPAAINQPAAQNNQEKPTSTKTDKYLPIAKLIIQGNEKGFRGRVYANQEIKEKLTNLLAEKFSAKEDLHPKLNALDDDDKKQKFASEVIKAFSEIDFQRSCKFRNLGYQKIGLNTLVDLIIAISESIFSWSLNPLKDWINSNAKVVIKDENTFMQVIQGQDESEPKRANLDKIIDAIDKEINQGKQKT